ncbi:hypothetical protein EG329_001526 [Mollisiaceae sp. DMI_Dod_QoI]|nr:hypothetical protein EG329_001526 [Helotiales sp. DMI_Dod_QoI]
MTSSILPLEPISNALAEEHFTQHPTRGNQIVSPSFDVLESFREIIGEDGLRIFPEIHCKIAKGFFLAEDVWTCYRRNYFLVECAYSLLPRVNPEARLQLRPKDRSAPTSASRIQSLAVCLSASTTNAPKQLVELVQHTPRRNKGPQLEPQKIKLLPIASDIANCVNFQSPDDGGLRQAGTYHAFDRLQFKAATANNGKRRATQQYFRIIVELWAETYQEGNENIQWVKIAHRRSERLVVRGRSPGHYQSESRGWGPSMADLGGFTFRSLKFPGENHDHQDSAPILERDDEQKTALFPARPAQVSSEVAQELSDVNLVAKGVDKYEEVFLDDSSISSIERSSMDSFGQSSRSSFTSFSVEPSIADKFAKLLLESDGIRSLSEACFSVENEDRTERNISRLLKALAVNLKSAASNQVDGAAASLLLRHAKRVASSIRRQTTKNKSLLIAQQIAQTGDLKESVMDRFLLDLALKQEELFDDELESIDDVQDVEIAEDNFNAIKSEDEDKSDNGFGEPLSGKVSIEVKMGAHFLRRSEALAEFREGLIDFSVAVKNARHNSQIIHEKDKELLFESSMFHNWRIAALNSQTLLWLVGGRGWRKFRDLLGGISNRIRKDCGDVLYADFSNTDPNAIDALEAALNQQRPAERSNHHTNSANVAARNCTPASRSIIATCNALSSLNETSNVDRQTIDLNFVRDDASNEHDYHPTFFAVCIPAGGIYKALTEIDMSGIKSDAGLFLAIKSIYRKRKGSKARWNMFLKPVGVDFIQFSLWNIRSRYVSIYDRPRCVPPNDNLQYDFCPRPMAPLPPVPPEIFIHYLEHNDSDLDPQRTSHNMSTKLPNELARVTSRIEYFEHSFARGRHGHLRSRLEDIQRQAQNRWEGWGDPDERVLEELRMLDMDVERQINMCLMAQTYIPERRWR